MDCDIDKKNIILIIYIGYSNNDRWPHAASVGLLRGGGHRRQLPGRRRKTLSLATDRLIIGQESGKAVAAQPARPQRLPRRSDRSRTILLRAHACIPA